MRAAEQRRLDPFAQVLSRAINDLNTEVTRHKLLTYSLLLIAIAGTKGIFQFLTRWLLIGISREIEFDLRNDLFRHLEKQCTRFTSAIAPATSWRATNDLNAVRMLLGPAIMYSANTVVLPFGALFFLLHYSPYLTLVAFAPAPLASIVTQYLGRKIHDRFERIQASFSEISAQAQENYSGARLVRAFAREGSQISLFERLNREYIARCLRLVAHGHALAHAGIHPRRFHDHYPACRRPLGHPGQVIDLGQFVAFNTYMILLIWPIIAVGWVVNIFQRGTASDGDASTNLRQSRPSPTPPVPPPARLGELVGEIEFRDLTFRYDDPRKTARGTTASGLQNVNLKCRPDEPGHRRPDRLRQNRRSSTSFRAIYDAAGVAADRRQADPRIST